MAAFNDPVVLLLRLSLTTPTQKLHCLHVFRQAGPLQRVDCLAPKWETALSVFSKDTTTCSFATFRLLARRLYQLSHAAATLLLRNILKNRQFWWRHRSSNLFKMSGKIILWFDWRIRSHDFWNIKISEYLYYLLFNKHTILFFRHFQQAYGSQWYH